jgi:putative ABC transport system ATP-binding protein
MTAHVTDLIVDLRRVTREFGGGTTVTALADIEFQVASGDYMAITGPSGAGKSTLLNILGLLDRPSTGEYLFDGVPTSSLRERERSALRGSNIGFVFQSFHLLPSRTVLDNVLLAFVYGDVPRGERMPRAREALRRVGLAHRVDFYPGTLSGGERQRVAIARAVCTAPRLLLADEPTGNLDRSNSASIMELFEELNRDGLTVLMITHDAAIADRARRTVRIDDGRLTESPRR